VTKLSTGLFTYESRQKWNGPLQWSTDISKAFSATLPTSLAFVIYWRHISVVADLIKLQILHYRVRNYFSLSFIRFVVL